MHRKLCKLLREQYAMLKDVAKEVCPVGRISRFELQHVLAINHAANAARHEGFWSENEPADEPSEMTPADEPASEVEPADEPVGCGPAPSSFSLATQAYTIESSC